MQVTRFSNGGFAIHKVANGAGRASAWFDDAGSLVDIEAFDRMGRHSRPSQALKEECKRLGQRVKTRAGD